VRDEFVEGLYAKKKDEEDKLVNWRFKAKPIPESTTSNLFTE
jgi:hypothetical protein